MSRRASSSVCPGHQPLEFGGFPAACVTQPVVDDVHDCLVEGGVGCWPPLLATAATYHPSARAWSS